jgi:hypothetical protein
VLDVFGTKDDRYKLLVNGRNWTAIKWDTDRLDYVKDQTYGEFYCNNDLKGLPGVPDRKWRAREIVLPPSLADALEISEILSVDRIQLKDDSVINRIAAHGMNYDWDNHVDGDRAEFDPLEDGHLEQKDGLFIPQGRRLAEAGWGQEVGAAGRELYGGSLDNRRPHGLSYYFGKKFKWERTGGELEDRLDTIEDKFVEIEIQCFNTKFPTQSPTVSPTFSPTASPTSSPTDGCPAMILTGTQVSYDGIYYLQTGTINGLRWWMSRDDVGGIGKGLQIKLYYYKGMRGDRWRLEGPDYSFWAPDDIISRDELKQRIEGNKDHGARTACGPIPDLAGWWFSPGEQPVVNVLDVSQALVDLDITAGLRARPATCDYAFLLQSKIVKTSANCSKLLYIRSSGLNCVLIV